MPNQRFKIKRITITAIFSVGIFVFKSILPTPIDKMFVIVQALLLALSYLLMGRGGATYVATISGLLTTIWRFSFFPFSLIFAVVYGLLVDGSSSAFKVRSPHGDVKTGRLVASLTLSTAAVGLLTTYITVSLGLMPMMPMLYIIIVLAGTINGVTAGYVASFLWEKYLFRYAV